jgi:hypothetical protein
MKMRERAFAVVGCLLAAACNGSGSGTVDGQRSIGPSVISLGIDDHLQRPGVDFDHDRHSRALGDGSCKSCHERRDSRLVGMFARTEDPADRDALMELYHDRCIGCHRQTGDQGKRTGPVTCGECHRAGPDPRAEGRGEAPPRAGAERPRTLRRPIRFDYSLHGRHVQAVQPCGECHHAPGPDGKLAAAKGKEQGCIGCHGARDEGRRLSLRNASHRSCVTCHLDRARRGKSGPVDCAGCHDAARQRAIATLAAPPRIDRKQPAMVAIKAPGAKAGAVRFNHLGHEDKAPFCSTCHHRGLRPCRECHSLVGAGKRGGGVTLGRAHHHRRSEHSCIGCHAKTTSRPDCAGCHSQLARSEATRACTVCHQPGSSAGGSAGAGGAAPSTPKQEAAPPELAALPPVSVDFPETVTIDALARVYMPSVLPHKKIVARLDAAVRRSKLARAFHGETNVLCAGCHHRSPVGQRPPACRSCHGETAAATTGTQDRPRLLNAYHRQCIGCHQKMGIRDDCTTCHAAKTQEGGR